MTEGPLSSEDNHCFVCGPGNPIGLQLTFRIEGDLCLSEYTPGDNHGGYANRTHGGMIFCALDDVMANWLYLQGEIAYTAKCDIRYRQPLELGKTIRLEGRLVKRKGRLALMESSAIQVDGEILVADATASFMLAASR